MSYFYRMTWDKALRKNRYFSEETNFSNEAITLNCSNIFVLVTEY